MALCGSLCFCNDCGSLLDRAPTHQKHIQCDVCLIMNPNNWPQTVTTHSKASTFPSSLRNRLEGKVVQVPEGTEAQGQLIQRSCEKCSAPEVRFTTAQLRSADEGTTVFYFCPTCGHRFKEDN